MNEWEKLRMFIDRQKADTVAARVVKLDEAARKEVAEALPGHLKVLRGRREPWESLDDHAEVLRAAGAGVLPGAAAVTSWLSRREFTSRWGGPYGDTDRIMTILATRPAEWRADLARRLVLKLRTAEDRDLGLTLALLRATGIEIPIHDPLVVGWVSTGGLSVPREDPLFDTLLPRVFDAQGVGRALQRENLAQPWLRSLRALAARDGAKRLMLLEGCISRFLRGGSAPDLRFFARLHEALDPAPHEIESRARDYLRLLPAAPGPIAELALRHLRTLDGLDPLDLVEGLESVLFRSERKLVRSGLTWLDQLVRLSPPLAGSIAGALVPVFASDSAELQERAVTLAIKHASRMGDEGHATIRDALDMLPYDLRLRAFAVFGGEEPAEPDPLDEFVPPALPRPDAPQRMADPIDSVAGMLSVITGPSEWMAWERLLAGFVALVHRDREGAAAALKPALAGKYDHFYQDSNRYQVGYGGEPDHWNYVDQWLVGAMRSLTGTASVHEAWKHKLPDVSRLSTPCLLLLHRAAEIHMAVETDVVPPLLLSTPTLVTGHVDASELVTRLEIIEAAGAKPLAADLQQALLRLRRDQDPQTAERAGRLSSPAGRLIARWLDEAPLADPAVEIRWSSSGKVERWLDDGETDNPHDVKLIPSLHAPVTGLPLIDLVFRDPPSGGTGIHLTWWAAMFPSHREVTATHLLPHLLRHQWHRPVRPSHLRQITRGDGPPGVSVSLILGLMLGDPGTPEAVDILLETAGRGDLNAAELGRQTALLVKREQMKLVHLTAALDSASSRGAHREVWTAIAAALPLLISGSGRKPHHGFAAFVALGATTAVWSHARGAIPELEAMAARKGSSGVLREARRLHGLLTAEEG